MANDGLQPRATSLLRWLIGGGSADWANGLTHLVFGV